MYFIIIEIYYMLRKKGAHIHNKTILCHGDHTRICVFTTRANRWQHQFGCIPIKHTTSKASLKNPLKGLISS